MKNQVFSLRIYIFQIRIYSFFLVSLKNFHILTDLVSIPLFYFTVVHTLASVEHDIRTDSTAACVICYDSGSRGNIQYFFQYHSKPLTYFSNGSGWYYCFINVYLISFLFRFSVQVCE